MAAFVFGDTNRKQTWVFGSVVYLWVPVEHTHLAAPLLISDWGPCWIRLNALNGAVGVCFGPLTSGGLGSPLVSAGLYLPLKSRAVLHCNETYSTVSGFSFSRGTFLFSLSHTLTQEFLLLFFWSAPSCCVRARAGGARGEHLKQPEEFLGSAYAPVLIWKRSFISQTLASAGHQRSSDGGRRKGLPWQPGDVTKGDRSWTTRPFQVWQRRQSRAEPKERVGTLWRRRPARSHDMLVP